MEMAALLNEDVLPRSRSQRSAALQARTQMAATAALAYDLPVRFISLLARTVPLGFWI